MGLLHETTESSTYSGTSRGFRDTKHNMMVPFFSRFNHLRPSSFRCETEECTPTFVVEVTLSLPSRDQRPHYKVLLRVDGDDVFSKCTLRLSSSTDIRGKSRVHELFCPECVVTRRSSSMNPRSVGSESSVLTGSGIRKIGSVFGI